MTEGNNYEDMDDYEDVFDPEEEWMDIYERPHDFGPYCGNHAHLQPYKDFIYYQCWGGGPEGGYIAGGRDLLCRVNRTWGEPFTVEPVVGVIHFRRRIGGAWNMRMRIVQDEDAHEHLRQRAMRYQGERKEGETEQA